ncbi:MAG: flagellar filament capping protein FliD [Alcaligenes nematophilus]|uniref:flagellar filament capping protein FliD n=1 Tax=Alcaligenes nematophilus TaxID=2994643 RepID=UPI003CFC0BEB
MAVSSIASGAGLPLEELMTKLRNSENVALATIQTRQSASEARLSAYGKVRQSLEALQKAAQALNNTDTYGALKSTVSSESISIDASPKATAGEYAIVVDRLATSQSLIGAGQSSRSDAIGTGGKITITLVSGKEKTIDLTDKATSLEGIIQALNGEADSGVRATLINDGSDQPHKLLLTATNTGDQAAVAKIRVQGNDELAEVLSFTQPSLPDGMINDTAPAGIFTQKAAQNAVLNINGIDITSQSNQVNNVIEGVTFTLNKTSADPINVKIERDDSVAKQAIQDFVTAYNALHSLIKTQSNYDMEAKKGSPLTGDQLARRIQTDISKALSIVGDGDKLRTLYSAGIGINVKTGELEIDETKLNTALTDHVADFAKLMIGETGLGQSIDKAANAFVKEEGYLDFAKDSIDKTLANLKKQYEATALRIDSRMESYRQQFLALDKAVIQMQGISSYLTQQLSMLGSNSANNK